MAEYTARIIWERDEEPFLDKKYSRRHEWHFDGGAVVVASSSPNTIPVPMSDPFGVDPEEAFVASISSCHMLWFLALAAKHKFCVDRYHDAPFGQMSKNAEGKTSVTKVTLRPKVDFCGDVQPSHQQIQDLHHEAHDLCFIANSVKSEVVVEPVF
ncbi:OsmC family peroxiredoxin [Bremerella cremea]|uniref:Peroxiredoxin n=1 Tax=Blastopirellula marina TaxID=124 RepID=A0A2S8G6H8_9BACT|nr:MULTISPECIES: OsmC family protein [Pirellulaceae]PQO39861.1 peroxiredoxin [Blastopirellula marina]RCS51327.1 OsmC family peroxiredoxin [Bremerella cremea]